MLAVLFLRDCILLCFADGNLPHAYTVAYAITGIPLLIAYGAAAAAAFAQVVSLYQQIGRFATRLLVFCLFVAAVSCLATLHWELARMGDGVALARASILVTRWVCGIASGALLLAMAFFAYFPAPLRKLPRNLKLHTALLAAYFVFYTATFLFANLLPRQTQWFERVHWLIVACLYVAWIVGMKSSGEESEPWPQIDPETAKHLLTHEAEARRFFTGAA